MRNPRDATHTWSARPGGWDGAQDKVRRWIGEYDTLPDARITLADEETDTMLTMWPKES